ncbi:MAG: sulfotransferase [Bacteroidales bacterium]|nr:sulfotransferase [Bacteroidales bacterium]
MYNIKLFIRLIAHSFSLNRKSLMFISVKRVLSILIFLPLFLCTLIVNRIFMLLDEVFFSQYHRVEIKKAAFIIGVPRSATTYLFSILFRDRKNFHGFKLWELVFAPSVCQKYLFLAVRAVDRTIGSPLYRLSLVADRAIFGKFVNIHDIGLSKPEEDEALFLYNLSSLFLFYFWPEPKIMDCIFYHDQKLPDKVKRRNINFYYRCIQRHKYVFDRNNEKYFISKSPTFIPRMKSIAERFVDARFIYPLRTPYSTIPSTISLNAHIMSGFCRLPEEYPFITQTRDFVLEWYVVAEQTMREDIKERGMTVLYDRITQDPGGLLTDLYSFLDIDGTGRVSSDSDYRQHGKEYISRHIYPKDLGIDEKLIKEKLEGVLPAGLLIRK